MSDKMLGILVHLEIRCMDSVQVLIGSCEDAGVIWYERTISGLSIGFYASYHSS
jgi:hypothetical protein